MKTDAILKIKQYLNTPQKIVIVPHKNPDGDAIGASLGLFHFLKTQEQNPVIIAPNDYPEFLKWMPGDSEILKYDTQTGICTQLINAATLIFTLDFNALDRAGDMAPLLDASKAIKIMIDHHQQPDTYATFMYSDVSMSSTCEMVFNFIDMLAGKQHITADIATCLYTGIMTDTGSFRFASTTSQTHRVIAFLMDQGAQNSAIHNAVMDANSYNRMQLLGQALTNLKLLPEFNTAYITLTQEELNKHHFQKGDTEGFVNYALSLKNVIFAAIFIEDKPNNIIKISLRSKGDFSVNALARTHFNGGGHTNAAGGKSELNLSETVEKFISILPAYKDALQND
ncbi:bifunctional oligoribonuclease/PAP phosphatase NrnA [Bizionia sediminis]|uniref:Bifunctional oligoribonuclease/PAP phosphatase NrnA n=1 Tax=Bizionia sediminis TaxID=1737064 RepID=A0ABW5KNY4_9FLAO